MSEFKNVALLELMIEKRFEGVEQTVTAVNTSVSDLKASVEKRFNVHQGLILLGFLPTLRAIGIPTDQVIPVVVKSILGFIGLHIA